MYKDIPVTINELGVFIEAKTWLEQHPHYYPHSVQECKSDKGNVLYKMLLDRRTGDAVKCDVCEREHTWDREC